MFFMPALNIQGLLGKLDPKMLQGLGGMGGIGGGGVPSLPQSLGPMGPMAGSSAAGIQQFKTASLQPPPMGAMQRFGVKAGEFFNNPMVQQGMGLLAGGGQKQQDQQGQQDRIHEALVMKMLQGRGLL